VESPLGLQRLSLHAQAAQTQKNCGQIVAELAQAPRVAEDLLKFTYQPPRTRGDLAARTSAPFSDQALIEDVLALVKGGKDQMSISVGQPLSSGLPISPPKSTARASFATCATSQLT
jgi:hypothetical protein